ISVSNLPKNYNLRLYNASNILIATSANGGLTTEKIFYNNTLANGTYYIKVYPGSASQFDAANCYSLQIEKRNTPYPKIGATNSPEAETTVVKVFPNPANDQITFIRNSGLIVELKIIDISGREVLMNRPGPEQSEVSIDISSLSNGTYFAVITGNEDLVTTKFIVQK
ncbi:MAG: T9SS type A sorting domain-containing protein, partial [Chitinophagales bacterium]